MIRRWVTAQIVETLTCMRKRLMIPQLSSEDHYGRVMLQMKLNIAKLRSARQVYEAWLPLYLPLHTSPLHLCRQIQNRSAQVPTHQQMTKQ